MVNNPFLKQGSTIKIYNYCSSFVKVEIMKIFVLYLIVMVNISGKYSEAHTSDKEFTATTTMHTNYTEQDSIVNCNTTLTAATTPSDTVYRHGLCIFTCSQDSTTVLSVAGGAFLLTSTIFCFCGFLCGCYCLSLYQTESRSRHHRRSLQNNASDKAVQVPPPQVKGPKPPRPPPPIYEYVPSSRPSDKVKEQTIEKKVSKSEEQCLDTPVTTDKVKEQNVEKKASESEEQCLDTPVARETNKQDLDIKLNMNEGQNFDTKTNENSEQDLEMEENKAYCPTQEFIDVTSST